MHVHVEQVTWEDLHPRTLRKLKSLTCAPSTSVMYPQAERQDPAVKVFIARNRSGKIVGWSTAEHFLDGWHNYAVRYYDIDVFVDPQYRYKGIGTKILAFAISKLRKYKRKFEVPSDLDKEGKYGREF